jgi:RHS repeat-associated protein
VTDPSSSSNATYAWAARNDLYKVTSNNGTDTYTYDAGGRRETAVSGGNTTSYLYDGDTPVSAGPVSMVSLPGSNEILTLSGVVPIHDALGTTLATVNSAGALATQYTYDPFGNVTPGSTGYGTTFGMGGIELDPTGLYHTDARYYNPTLQRFLSEDPAGYAGGSANLFAYAGNGPVGASDPSGLDSCLDGDCGGGQPSNNPLPSPGGLDGLIQEILQAIFGVSPTSTAPPANHTNFQDIKQAGLTQFTAGTPMSGGTNVYGQEGGISPGGTARTDPSNSPPLQRVKDPAPSPTQTPQPQQNQQQHFWQKPGCVDALVGLGVGAVGTALTVGSIVAAPYLSPELFEGLEGLDAAGHMGIIAVPGATLMELGAVGVGQKCF